MSGLSFSTVSPLSMQRLEATAEDAQAQKALNQQHVAQEFESFFYSLLIKEMRQTLDQGLFGEEGSDAYGGLFDMFLGQHLGAAGGLGIDNYISQYVDAANSAEPAEGTDDVNDADTAENAKPEVTP
ncbi:MAG: rod-binding protein [Pirellulaceae bacterium]